MDRQHDEVVDRHRSYLRREVDDDIAVRGGDRRLQLLLSRDAHRLRAGELVGSDLGRRRAMRERLRHCGLEGLAHEDPGAGDRGDESAHHEKRDPRLASPGWRRLDVIRLDRRGPSRGTRLTHLRAAASAIA